MKITNLTVEIEPDYSAHWARRRLTTHVGYDNGHVVREERILDYKTAIWEAQAFLNDLVVGDE